MKSTKKFSQNCCVFPTMWYNVIVTKKVGYILKMRKEELNTTKILTLIFNLINTLVGIIGFIVSLVTLFKTNNNMAFVAVILFCILLMVNVVAITIAFIMGSRNYFYNNKDIKVLENSLSYHFSRKGECWVEKKLKIKAKHNGAHTYTDTFYWTSSEPYELVSEVNTPNCSISETTYGMYFAPLGQRRFEIIFNSLKKGHTIELKIKYSGFKDKDLMSKSCLSLTVKSKINKVNLEVIFDDEDFKDYAQEPFKYECYANHLSDTPSVERNLSLLEKKASYELDSPKIGSRHIILWNWKK